MIRYRTLTWDDFNGLRKPFTGWGAQIDSNVFIEFDSLENRFRAFSAMNASTSWKKSEKLSEYLLNHEQYHFDLTQYYALILDHQLVGINDLHEAVLKLNSIRIDLGKAQSKYDSESDHDLNYDMQYYWEFKIDSLTRSAIDSSSLKRSDLYTGLEFYNLEAFIKSKKFTDNGQFQTNYEASKYGLIISINSIVRDDIGDPSSYQTGLVDFYNKNSLVIKDLTHNQTENVHSYQAHVLDTVKSLMAFDYWLADSSSLHFLRTQRKMEETNFSGYQSIFKALSSSMKIRDFYREWISIADQQTQEITAVEKYNPEVDDECMVIDDQNTIGFISEFIPDNGDLLIPYTPVLHADSLISEALLIVNDNMIYSDISDSLIFRVPKKFLIERSNVFIGYILKSDSVNTCTTFLNTNFYIDRTIN